MLALLLVFYLGILAQFHLGAIFDATVAPALFAQPTTTLDYKTLNEIWQIMQRNYAKPGLSAADAFDAAAKGLVHLLLSTKYGDDFSAYQTPAELKADRAFPGGQLRRHRGDHDQPGGQVGHLQGIAVHTGSAGGAA